MRFAPVLDVSNPTTARASHSIRLFAPRSRCSPVSNLRRMACGAEGEQPCEFRGDFPPFTTWQWTSTRRHTTTADAKPVSQTQAMMRSLHGHRDAVEHGVARQRVDEQSRRSAGCEFTPAWRPATPSSTPAPVVAPAVRDAHDARADGVGHLDRHLRPTRPGSSPWPAPPSARPSRAASSGWTWSVQRGLPFTSTSTLCIHELFERRSRRPTSTNVRSSGRSSDRPQPGDVGEDRLGGQLDLPAGVRSTSGSRGSSGPRSTPWGCGSTSRAVEGSGRRAVRAEPVAVGAGAQHEVEQALGAARAARAPRGAPRGRGRGRGRARRPPRCATRAPIIRSSTTAGRRRRPCPGRSARAGEHLPLVELRRRRAARTGGE